MTASENASSERDSIARGQQRQWDAATVPATWHLEVFGPASERGQRCRGRRGLFSIRSGQSLEPWSCRREDPNMRMSRTWNAAVVAVLAAGGLALGAASPAAAVPGGGPEARAASAAPAGPTAGLSVPGGLDGVAALSSSNAWAVGQTS